ncbi:pilus assembly protein PilM [sulfur-oxidizing endosymbiont of Gigantopelta aegis]|uniref:pilus assembly protein PilM n=1 Tax=sulfur-oxidizing endosymbiont of Gigantopelta aegis TaxID=2794934 RepID=UPI0018DCF487|nr:pilus assembly protein PilM [sulfur-oxidizing endosymbiont of Gigantopelta aegis]
MMQFPFFKQKKNAEGLIGVDFRASRVAMAHLLPGKKPIFKPTLKQCAFEILPDESADALNTGSAPNHHAQNDALKKIVHSFPIKQFPCNSSIEKSAYELLLIDAPNVESSELKQAVRWRIKDQLAYHIDDAVIDVFEIPGQQSGRAQHMYVVASQKQQIDARVEQLQQAEMKLQAIDIYELAQRNIAAILPEDKDGIVMLRFNANSGLLTITRQGTLYLTRKIDFGINRLAQVLDSAFESENAENKSSESKGSEQNSFEEDDFNAEEIELNISDEDVIFDKEDDFKLPDSIHDLDGISFEDDIQEPDAEQSTINGLNEQGKLIVDEVILEIQRSLDYYVSHFNQRPVTKIILAPLVNEVPGLIEYIHEMLGVPVEALDFNEALNVAKPLSRELQAYCFYAIGLALRNEGQHSQKKQQGVQ